MAPRPLPSTTTPEALARHMGWSPRRVRKLARDLGACRILGNRMILLNEDVMAILASQGAEASLLTLPATPVPIPAPEPVQTIHTPKRGHIYYIECGGFIKIGYSTNPRARISSLQVSCPFPIVVLEIMPGTIDDERDLHKRFASYRTGGEWFRHEGKLAVWIVGGCRE